MNSDKVVLTRSQLFQLCQPARRFKSLVNRRFQSLGLQHVTSGVAVSRIATIEKKVQELSSRFFIERDISLLRSASETLSELFLLKGELILKDKYGDREYCYWSVTNGPSEEWIKEVAEANDKSVVSFNIDFDPCEQRKEHVLKNNLILGGYLLPSFIDLTKSVSPFIEIPEKVTFSGVKRIEQPQHLGTDYEQIITFEDSPFLSELKKSLLSSIEFLPDQTCLYVSAFNRIIDKAVFPYIDKDTADINSPSICQKMVEEFTDTLLSCPVYSTGVKDEYRIWTPWSFNFIDFSRLAYRFSSPVYTPDPGQLHWLSDEHRQMASYTLVNNIIPKRYQWQVGIPTLWKNQYRTHSEHKELLREWRT